MATRRRSVGNGGLDHRINLNGEDLGTPATRGRPAVQSLRREVVRVGGGIQSR